MKLFLNQKNNFLQKRLIFYQYKMKKQLLFAALAAGFAFVSCDDDDNNSNNNSSTESAFKYVFPATVEGSGESTLVLLATDTIDQGTISPVGQGITMESATFYITYKNKYFYAMKYNQGNNGTNQSFELDANGNLRERDWKLSGARFTSLGIIGDNIVTVSTAAGPNSLADANKNLPYVFAFTYIDPENESQTFNDTVNTKFLSEDFLGNGEYVTLCGLVEANDKFITAAIPVGMSNYGVANYYDKITYPELIATTDGGSGSGAYTSGSISGTQYPNECWVAIFDDTQLNGKKLIKTDKISYAAGRYRSQYHQMTWATDNGDVYVFSPSYAKTMAKDVQRTTLPAGVVRIASGTTEFDSYYCNLEELTSGKGFLRCWYLEDDKFLLQLYEDAYVEGAKSTVSDALTLAIFDASDKSLTYVTGLPDKSIISNLCHGINKAFVENGKTYVDVSTTEGNPAFYVVDIATGVATKGAEVIASAINCVGKLYVPAE